MAVLINTPRHPRITGPIHRYLLLRPLPRRLDTPLQLLVGRIFLLPGLANPEIAVHRIAVLVDPRLVVNFVRSHALGSQGWIEAGADGFDHLAEPEDIEAVEHDVGNEVDERNPEGNVLFRIKGCHLSLRVARHIEQLLCCQSVQCPARYAGLEVRVPVPIGPVHVAEDPDGAVDAPDQAAAEECDDEEDAVDGLVDGAGEFELVAEPVDVEEGAAQLVEEEDGGGEVDEGALYPSASACGKYTAAIWWRERRTVHT